MVVSHSVIASSNDWPFLIRWSSTAGQASPTQQGSMASAFAKLQGLKK
jgi:hypothetical protein